MVHHKNKKAGLVPYTGETHQYAQNKPMPKNPIK